MTPRRYSPVVQLGALVIALVLFVSLLALLLWLRFDSIEEQNRNDRRRAECRSVLIADLFADSFDALAAPPVDPKLTPAEQAKTQRGKAVAAGSKNAAQLHRANTVCP